MEEPKRIAVFCVGNVLMLDDGLGPAVYRELSAYDFGDGVDLFDVGCMSMELVGAVDEYDLIIAVDAVDGTGHEPGTLFRFDPGDMAPRPFGSQSLHDLKLSDLFQAAMLLGYEAQGVCLGMQVENASPSRAAIGLTDAVHAKLADLVDCVLAELVRAGVAVRVRETGEPVEPGFHHRLSGREGDVL